MLAGEKKAVLREKSPVFFASGQMNELLQVRPLGRVREGGREGGTGEGREGVRK